MLIGFWTGILIAIGLAVLLILLFAKVSKLMKKTGAAGGITGFFVGVALIVVVIIVPSRAYVVTGETDCDTYLVFGSPEFEMADGQKVTVDISSGFCMIINNTEDRIMLEEVVYGFGFSPSPWQVSGMDYGLIETPSIDYFFDDVPPDEISVSEESGNVSRWWMRRARE